MDQMLRIIIEMSVLLTIVSLIIVNRKRISVNENATKQQEDINIRQQSVIVDIQNRQLEQQRLFAERLAESERHHSGKIASLQERLDREADEKSKMKERHSVELSDLMREHAKDRENEYKRGVLDGTKDFSILCQPFCIEDSGWFSSSYRAGYRYQLLIRGVPALDSKDIILRDVKAVDENVKNMIVSAAKGALTVMAQSQGIHLAFAEHVAIEKK